MKINYRQKLVDMAAFKENATLDKEGTGPHLQCVTGFNSKDTMTQVSCLESQPLPVTGNDIDLRGLCQYSDCDSLSGSRCMFPFKYLFAMNSPDFILMNMSLTGLKGGPMTPASQCRSQRPPSTAQLKSVRTGWQ